MIRMLTGRRTRSMVARSLFLLLFSCGSMPAFAAVPGALLLQHGWSLQTSRKVADGGEVVSSKGYHPKGWYSASMPSTVLATQVASHEFPDPYFGMNLRKIPGTTYPIGHNSFANLPMEPDSPYAVPWWYRTAFQVPATYRGKTIWLHFDGINYRANIWLNGRKLADAKDVAGAYRRYEFDVTSFLRPGEANVLAVETFAPTEKELGINWVDWNPTPPDKDMGIWGDVYITESGPVSVRFSQVVTHFSDESLQKADLTVNTQLQNATDHPVKGVLEAVLDRIRIRQDVMLAPKETKSVSFTPEQFAALQWKQPKVWWPREMGTPNLHDLAVSFAIGKIVSDEQHSRFGIREITSELTDKGYRLFRVNGKNILIRGGGWAKDMLLRESKENLEDQFQYVLDMHLNTIRLEAQLETEDFFNLADEKGILIMAGWCCCDMWEHWDQWQAETFHVATESLRAQSLRLRGHASLLTWLTGSDGPPPANVETAYRDVLKETAWPNPIVSSASDAPTTVSGPSGVKMSGPYDYEPPSYWLADTKKYGGAYGFNTETSPGPAIPPLDSLRKFLPKDHLWPIDEVWNFHSAGERFKDMARYNEGLAGTYGSPADLDDYLRKSQAMAYDGERAMFEAYARNKYTSTGVIQWMLNNAWPSTYWHLYDYYLYPAGGYFGTKKACEPLHVQYSYDDRSVVVISTVREAVPGLSVSAHVYDLQLKELAAQDGKLDAAPDSSTSVLTLPAFPEQPGAVYFVKLSLLDKAGKEVSSNFYWLPARLSTIDWEKTPDSAFTPVSQYEDMTALAHLPKVKLQAKGKLVSHDTVSVTVHNPSKDLAFQVHAGLRKMNSQSEILPIIWEDNYFSLLPGESRTVTGRMLRPDAGAPHDLIVVDGWNIDPVQVSVAK